MAIETNELIDVKTLSPFKKFIMTIGNLPTSYLDSMTYGELLMWFCNYLQETVIPTVNNNAEAVEELQRLYEQLHDYVENYFDNLDVQEEINAKLDKMAEDGSLTILIKNYVDPLYQAYENNINLTIQSMQSELASVVSGSPAGVYATTEDLETADPDHSKIYLVSDDGKWYYYDTSETAWTAGGVYQATIEDYDTTLTQNEAVPNSKSVGEKINENTITYNHFDKNNYQNNKHVNYQGLITDNNDYFITNLFEVKSGDDVYPAYIASTVHTTLEITRVLKCDAYGEIQSVVTPTSSNNHRYTADENTFIKLCINKGVATDENIPTSFCIGINNVPLVYKPYKYELNIDENEELNQISKYINLFDPNNFAYNCYINSSGFLLGTTNKVTLNPIKVSIGDTVYMAYFNNDNTIRFDTIALFDENMRYTSRVIRAAKNYTSTINGYIVPTIINNNSVDDIADYFTITKNQEITSYVPHKRYLIQNDSLYTVGINKNSSTNYEISFGSFKTNLIKTENADINVDNWNLSTVKDSVENVLVPVGTDIIGPIKLSGNADFIGGVHGNETTDYIKVGINNKTDDLADITQENGENLTITMASSIYDYSSHDKVADRHVNITFEPNKIHITNSFTFTSDVTLNSAPICGLIAARNNIIDSIMFNNHFFSSAPESSVDIKSKANTNATINTTYGSITANVIKGYDNQYYKGYLNVFTNENPKRCKAYFMLYDSGSYSINSGDTITGEFEYIFS